MLSVDHTGRYRQEQHALFGILGAELGHDHVHRDLANRVRTSSVEFVSCRHNIVGETSGNRDDLFGLAFQNERDEEVEKMDVADRVDTEGLEQVILEYLWLVSST